MDIGVEKRRALVCLVRYYSQIKKSRPIAREIRESKKPELTIQQYRQFLDEGGIKNYDYFYDYIKKRVCDEIFYRKSPEYVRNMISFIYGYGEKNTTQVDEILHTFAEIDYQSNLALSEEYKGAYNTYRYSAGKDEERKRFPTIVWARLEVYPLGDGDVFPNFRLYYRGTTDTKNEYSTVEGVLVKIKAGGGLLFWGHEAGEHPFMMVTYYNTTSATPILGAIIRKRKINKTVLFGKILIKKIENDIVEEDSLLDRFEEKIGIYPQKEIERADDGIVDLFRKLELNVALNGKRSQIVE